MDEVECTVYVSGKTSISKEYFAIILMSNGKNYVIL